MKSIESMTGYGEAQFKVDGIQLSCRVRSLNHRFLDIKLRLPRFELLALDMAIRRQVSRSFERGAIEISVSAENTSGTADKILNFQVAHRYWEAAGKLAKDLPKKKKVDLPSIDTLLRLPGVIDSSSAESALNEFTEDELLEKLIEPALKSLKKSRQGEGKKLFEHLIELLEQLDGHLRAIEGLEAPEKEKLRNTLTQRARETLRLLSNTSENTANLHDFEKRLHE
ncbi:MAG: YicC/YloC family endoribonuclease, partial [Bdellovibrionota bacterium]